MKENNRKNQRRIRARTRLLGWIEYDKHQRNFLRIIRQEDELAVLNSRIVGGSNNG